MNRTGWLFVALVASLAVLACVGKRDADVDREIYCENVTAGTWPDYRDSYREECGGKNPPDFNEELTK